MGNINAVMGGAVFTVEGPVSMFYFKDIGGREIVLFGDEHTQKVVTPGNPDEERMKKLIYLIKNLSGNAMMQDVTKYYTDQNLKNTNTMEIIEWVIKLCFSKKCIDIYTEIQTKALWQEPAVHINDKSVIITALYALLSSICPWFKNPELRINCPKNIRHHTIDARNKHRITTNSTIMFMGNASKDRWRDKKIGLFEELTHTIINNTWNNMPIKDAMYVKIDAKINDWRIRFDSINNPTLNVNMMMLENFYFDHGLLPYRTLAYILCFIYSTKFQLILLDGNFDNFSNSINVIELLTHLGGVAFENAVSVNNKLNLAFSVANKPIVEQKLEEMKNDKKKLEEIISIYRSFKNILTDLPKWKTARDDALDLIGKKFRKSIFNNLPNYDHFKKSLDKASENSTLTDRKASAFGYATRTMDLYTIFRMFTSVVDFNKKTHASICHTTLPKNILYHAGAAHTEMVNEFIQLYFVTGPDEQTPFNSGAMVKTHSFSSEPFTGPNNMPESNINRYSQCGR